MIQLDNEHIVKCEDCGQDAIQRQVWVSHHGIRKFIVYDTHHQDAKSKYHAAVLSRVDDFHEQAFKLEESLNKKKDELEFGTIERVEIYTVKPSACKRRTQIRPVVAVRAFGMQDEIPLEARTLTARQSKSLSDEVVENANILAQQLKRKFDKGRF